MSHRCLFAVLSLFLALTTSAPAGDDDHDRARQALQRGDIRPLADILGQLRAELGGEVIEVEFNDRKRGRNYTYEFKVLTKAGRLSEVTVDAATAEILEREDDD
jgi:uncharacterized membrane protein YkoI